MLFLYWSPPPPLPPPSPVAPLLLLRLVIDVVAKGRLRGLSSVTRKAYRMVFGVSDTTREREREREREQIAPDTRLPTPPLLPSSSLLL